MIYKSALDQISEVMFNLICELSENSICLMMNNFANLMILVRIGWPYFFFNFLVPWNLYLYVDI